VPAQGPEEQVAAYQYDANGLRVRKADSGGDRSFLLDGLSIAAEYSAPGVREAWYTQSLARIDEPLSVVNGQGKYWYQADALGSVYALTTSTGAVQARGGYDAFGEPVALGGTAVGQPFGFTGREHEVESGLVYSRHRLVDDARGRWLTPDPLGEMAGPNLYLYSASSPVRFTDPSGLAFTSTMDAYAVFQAEAFLSLMLDLGAISARALVAAGGATLIATTISTMSVPRVKARDRADVACEPFPIPPSFGVYYRGLSPEDLEEFWRDGAIRSKFFRRGIGAIWEGLQEALDPGTGIHHAAIGSEDTRGDWLSPLVSVTTQRSVASWFASHSTGKVVEFTTPRNPMFKGLTPDAEWLFFWQLGFPGETLRLLD
jgi:RHS repeat-associated protein